MLNLNIMLSNFETEIIILPWATDTKMKNGVAYKNKMGVPLKGGSIFSGRKSMLAAMTLEDTHSIVSLKS